MSRMQPCSITENGLSVAWAKALMLGLGRNVEIAPLTLRIYGLEEDRPLEDPELRGCLDAYLSSLSKSGVETVASTIFPERRWRVSNGDRSVLFKDFLRAYPRLKRIDPQNRKGTYFGRLIEPIPSVPEGQLERIIQLYRKNPGVVRMKLQAAIFRPEADHEKGARPGFPCMQQISVVPHGGLLSLNAFYASQQIVLKGYGNYLGLIRLGRFLAGQMDLTLGSLNVFVGVAKIGDIDQLSPEFEALSGAAKSLASAAYLAGAL